MLTFPHAIRIQQNKARSAHEIIAAHRLKIDIAPDRRRVIVRDLDRRGLRF